MAKIIGDSQFLNEWAKDANNIAPTLGKQRQGWVLGEQPRIENFNWIQNSISHNINEFLKNGVASYDGTLNYAKDAIVRYEGGLYISTVDNPTTLPNSGIGWKSVTAQSKLGLIKAPTITTPTEGQNDFTGDVIVTAYETADNFQGDKTHTQIQVAFDSDFTNIFFDDIVSYTTNLSWGSIADRTLFVRVRHISGDIAGAWSRRVKFFSSSVGVETPNISVEQQNGLIVAEPVITISEFTLSANSSSDTYDRTSISVVDTTTNEEEYFFEGDLSSTLDGGKYFHVVPDGILLEGTEYRFNVIHFADSGARSASGIFIGTTEADFLFPCVLSASNSGPFLSAHRRVASIYELKSEKLYSGAAITHQLFSIVFSPDNRYVAYGMDYGRLVIYDLVDREVTAQYTVSQDFTLIIKSVDWSVDNYIAIGSLNLSNIRGDEFNRLTILKFDNNQLDAVFSDIITTVPSAGSAENRVPACTVRFNPTGEYLVAHYASKGEFVSGFVKEKNLGVIRVFRFKPNAEYPRYQIYRENSVYSFYDVIICGHTIDFLAPNVFTNASIVKEEGFKVRYNYYTIDGDNVTETSQSLFPVGNRTSVAVHPAENVVAFSHVSGGVGFYSFDSSYKITLIANYDFNDSDFRLNSLKWDDTGEYLLGARPFRGTDKGVVVYQKDGNTLTRIDELDTEGRRLSLATSN